MRELIMACGCIGRQCINCTDELGHPSQRIFALIGNRIFRQGHLHFCPLRHFDLGGQRNTMVLDARGDRHSTSMSLLLVVSKD